MQIQKVAYRQVMQQKWPWMMLEMRLEMNVEVASAVTAQSRTGATSSRQFIHGCTPAFIHNGVLVFKTTTVS